MIGSIAAFISSNATIGNVLSIGEELVALVLYTLSVILVPSLGILVGEVVVGRTKLGGSLSTFVPALTFALAGIAQERTGVGRTGW